MTFVASSPSVEAGPCERCGAGTRRDWLTGLADRQTFQARLDAILAECMGAAALLLIDLDRFKTVNDALGHPIGDALLRLASRRLQSALRSDDVAARLGGDEFAILLAAPSAEAEALTIGARLVDLLARPFVIGGQVAQLGASIGIALTPQDGMDGETLMRRAELALYQSKLKGRGRVSLFMPELERHAEARRLLEQALRAALPMGELELFYQPQMALAGSTLCGFEALLRWRRPGIGLASPAKFIPLAEEIGLIGKLGSWVIRTATAECARWPAPLRVSVNVAAQQFHDGKLVRVVTEALDAAGLAGDRLELEITESALLGDADGSTLAQLRAIKARGVQISLDDFGTGYSSLSQLRSFPFDRIKIDRSFANDIPVVRAVAALGESLGMRTTAEGVETAEQLARMVAEGCTEAQGYLLGHPAPASDLPGIIDRLRRSSP